MKFRFFSVPVRKSSDAEEELNTFVASHRVVSIERRFVDAGLDSFWAVSVEVLALVACWISREGSEGRLLWHLPCSIVSRVAYPSYFSD